jgi:hypothetical protein
VFILFKACKFVNYLDRNLKINNTQGTKCDIIRKWLLIGNQASMELFTVISELEKETIFKGYVFAVDGS